MEQVPSEIQASGIVIPCVIRKHLAYARHRTSLSLIWAETSEGAYVVWRCTALSVVAAAHSRTASFTRITTLVLVTADLTFWVLLH